VRHFCISRDRVDKMIGFTEIIDRWLRCSCCCTTRPDTRRRTSAKGNDKGAVEGIVGWSRRNFMVPLPRFATWDDFNIWLEEQCRKRQARSCAGTRRRSGSGSSAISRR
jgi:transposase